MLLDALISSHRTLIAIVSSSKRKRSEPFHSGLTSGNDFAELNNENNNNNKSELRKSGYFFFLNTFISANFEQKMQAVYFFVLEININFYL